MLNVVQKLKSDEKEKCDLFLKQYDKNVNKFIESAGQYISHLDFGPKKENADQILKGVIVTPLIELHKYLKKHDFEGKSELLKQVEKRMKEINHDTDFKWSLAKDQKGLESPLVGEEVLFLPAGFMMGGARIIASKIPVYIEKAFFMSNGDALVLRGEELVLQTITRLNPEVRARAIDNAIGFSKDLVSGYLKSHTIKPSEAAVLDAHAITEELSSKWLPDQVRNYRRIVHPGAFRAQTEASFEEFFKYVGSKGPKPEWIQLSFE